MRNKLLAGSIFPGSVFHIKVHLKTLSWRLKLGSSVCQAWAMPIAEDQRLDSRWGQLFYTPLGSGPGTAGPRKHWWNWESLHRHWGVKPNSLNLGKSERGGGGQGDQKARWPHRLSFIYWFLTNQKKINDCKSLVILWFCCALHNNSVFLLLYITSFFMPPHLLSAAAWKVPNQDNGSSNQSQPATRVTITWAPFKSMLLR